MTIPNLIFIGIGLSLSCGPVTKHPDVKSIVEYDTDKAYEINDIADTCIAAGFDYPVGDVNGKGSYISLADGKRYDSWYNSTKFAEVYKLGIHPGIDLNGSGGSNTDLGQPVYSIAKGWVMEAKDFGPPWGNVILIRHKYLENAKVKYCYSLYAHLESLKIKKGHFVNKRSVVGSIGTGGGSYPAHLHLEIRKEPMASFETTYWPSSNSKDVKWVREMYEDPEVFIKEHRHLTSPSQENAIIIAIKNQYKLYYYNNGKLVNEYEIALSQNPIGHKELEGDLKLPEGEYYIAQKQKGPFYGNYAEFLGSRTLRISYPNKTDAINGYRKGLITKEERDEIISANDKGSISPHNTKLGGKIVIHGWNGDWTANGNQNLTWGCISMHNKDLEKFYEVVNVKTKILIFP